MCSVTDIESVDVGTNEWLDELWALKGFRYFELIDIKEVNHISEVESGLRADEGLAV